LTRQFYSIFNGKKTISVEEINALFNKYLADGSLTVEKSNEGKSYAKLNSMRAVTRYLDDHPDVKACDFRCLKTQVQDIPALADYLKKSTIKAIAINSGIPADAKTSLAEAVAARKGGLKVQYFN